MDKIRGVGGTRELPAVIVDFAANLSSQETADRMDAVKSANEVTAVSADLGIVRAFQQQRPEVGRIVVVTASDRQGRSPNQLQDLLVQDVSVTGAVSVGANAIGVDYYPNISEIELQNRKLLGAIRDESWQRKLPVFAFVNPEHSTGEALIDSSRADTKVRLVHQAARLGPDAIIVNTYPGGAKKIVEASSHLNVPVHLRLGGDFNTQEIFEQAAEAKDAGARGVVIGPLFLSDGDGQPTLRHMIEGISSVVRRKKSPNDAYLEATRTRR